MFCVCARLFFGEQTNVDKNGRLKDRVFFVCLFRLFTYKRAFFGSCALGGGGDEKVEKKKKKPTERLKYSVLMRKRVFKAQTAKVGRPTARQLCRRHVGDGGDAAEEASGGGIFVDGGDRCGARLFDDRRMSTASMLLCRCFCVRRGRRRFCRRKLVAAIVAHRRRDGGSRRAR